MCRCHCQVCVGVPVTYETDFYICLMAVPVATSGSGGLIYEAKIEDGKLFYENRWFHKGQHIFIESKEHGQERWGAPLSSMVH